MMQHNFFCVLVLLAGMGPAQAIELDLIDEFQWDEVDDNLLRNPAFGHALAGNGEFAVVAAVGQNDFRGELYLFSFNPAGSPAWQFVKQLDEPPNLGPLARLGNRLAMDDRWLVAGSGNDGAHLYRRNAGGSNGWGLVDSLRESDTPDRLIEFFGWDVALDGPRLAVSDKGTDYAAGGVITNQVGSVFIYEQASPGSDSWVRTARVDIPAGDAEAGAEFGHAIALAGETLVVSAVGLDGAAGKAWVFERDLGGGNAWGLRAELLNPAPSDNDRFGEDLVIEGDTIMVGSPGAGVSGTVFLFQRNQGGLSAWGAAPPIEPNQATSDFGRAVSRAGNTLLVGASLSHWVFERNAGLWGQTDSVTMPFRPARSYGLSVDLVQRGARVHGLVGDPTYVLTPPDSDRFGKAFFYLYDDGLFRDSFESR